MSYGWSVICVVALAGYTALEDQSMLKLASFAFFSLLASPAFAQVISVQGLLHVVIVLVILALVFWLIWWFIGYVGLPEPFNKVIRVIVGLIALLVVIYILLGLLGGGTIRIG